ncbi:MAG: molybdopterin-dependent oxidoreductase [Acidimicrobiia bacterium]
MRQRATDVAKSVLGRVADERDKALAQPTHSPRAAALLGSALGVSFLVCFLTGLLSHLAQQPPGWFTLPARPAGLYRVTQGVHVATGLASVPLLLAKLWTVYPGLFERPLVRSFEHFLERLSLFLLVCGSLFMLVTGVANISLWYPWPFFFPAAHYQVAWITIGALVVHIGAKAATTASALRRPKSVAPSTPGALSRRGLLVTAAGAAGLVTLATVGQTIRPLRRLSILAPRRPDVGPQGVPVNRAAVEAGVIEAASSDGYRLVVSGDVARPLSLTLADLEARPQRQAVLPIACVEGWSATGTWAGVPLRDLVEAAGAEVGNVAVEIRSLERNGIYARSQVNEVQAADRDTLLALRLGGEALHLDHGYPVRLIGPNRPGVMQTKWVTEIVVRAT